MNHHKLVTRMTKLERRNEELETRIKHLEIELAYVNRQRQATT